MAAPNKESLDYFPHDSDLSSDSKVEYLESEHGIVGYGIYIKLLERIYNNSYYLKFNKRDTILLSRKTKVSEEDVSEIIKTCVRERIFDKKIFDEYNVLTSHGIQKRYIKICERRKAIEIIKELALIDDPPANVSMVPIANCRDFVDDEDYKIKVYDVKKERDPIPKKKVEYGAEVYKLYDLFVSTLQNGQDAYLPKKDNDKERWYEAFDKCHRIDNYEWWQIADIINIARNHVGDKFSWSENFYTPLKLRTKNKENIKYIDYFWGKWQDLLTKPDEPELDYIEGLIGEDNENS